MPPATDHAADLALLTCLLLNAAVFGAAWRFARRRVTASPSQALLDAALLGYAVQYASVGLSGIVGLLRPAIVIGTAVVMSAALFVTAGTRRPTEPGRVAPGPAGPASRAVRRRPRETRAPLAPGRDGPALIRSGTDRPVVVAAGVFCLVVLVGYAWNQATLPVVSTDALTYHFPAAVQWLQRGRIGLFPTWFFNPANGYSPLAGSTLIAWLMVPLGSDVLARYVQVPALLCVGLGVYRLGRELSAGPPVAAAVGAAAVLCRPLFTAAVMGKDDLFVAFAFVAAVVAVAPDRSAEPFGAVRFGLAVGLMLAMKYTALLAVPVLVLAVPRWPVRRWAMAAVVAGLIAGPWYVRNWIVTGNPVFPLAVPHVFRGLFTAARSDAFRSPIDRRYGVPAAVFVVAVVGLLGVDWRRVRTDPLLRASVLGPPLGVALFFWRSPFPEVRFLFPALLLLLAAPAAAVARLPVRGRWVIWALPAASVATISIPGGWELFATLVPVAAVAAAAVAWVDAASRGRPSRPLAAGVPALAAAAVMYVAWTPFCVHYPDQWTSPASIWAIQYPAEAAVWRAVNQQVPADATVAYADLFLTYPLQGPTLRRRIGYAATRRSVVTPADLPWLGDRLSGERLVTAADAATVADPDPVAWRANLKRLGAGFLVVGQAVPGPAVEVAWADADPRHFRPLYAGPGGRVYAVTLAD